jgi:hypothetical protein
MTERKIFHGNDLFYEAKRVLADLHSHGLPYDGWHEPLFGHNFLCHTFEQQMPHIQKLREVLQAHAEKVPAQERQVNTVSQYLDFMEASYKTHQDLAAQTAAKGPAHLDKESRKRREGSTGREF